MAAVRRQIKHVIYIVKENRTYDQVFGDLPRGNGDPSLAILSPFSPNHKKLAMDFVLLDNFHDSGTVSGDGWNWSTAGRATDYTQKSVPVNYAGRGFSYDWEGANRNVNVSLPGLAERQAQNPAYPNDPNLLPGVADVAAPDSPKGEAGTGYLWDSALRAGLTVRNYGFFVANLPVPSSTFRTPFAHECSAVGAAEPGAGGSHRPLLSRLRPDKCRLLALQGVGAGVRSVRRKQEPAEPVVRAVPSRSLRELRDRNRRREHG